MNGQFIGELRDTSSISDHQECKDEICSIFTSQGFSTYHHVSALLQNDIFDYFITK